MADVAGLLLAAGAGRRLGRPKGLVELGGEPLVRRAARTLAEAGCDPVVVVVGAEAERVAAAVEVPSTIVRNDAWESGMGSSLRIGLSALPSSAQAAVVALVDQPGVTAAAIRRLVDAWRAGAKAAVASYEGEPRNPVLLDRSLWGPAAASAHGDVGARGYLRSESSLVTPVACEDVADPRDVDTVEDLAAARRGVAARAE